MSRFQKPASPQGPRPTLTERGLRFLRPQLHRVPWWRMVLEPDGVCLAYILPEPDPSDPVEPCPAALWVTMTGVFWATYKPLPETYSEDPEDYLRGLRILIDILRERPNEDTPGWPAGIAVVVTQRAGASEVTPATLPEPAQMLLMALHDEGAVRVTTALDAARVALDTMDLAWVRPPKVVKKLEIEPPSEKPARVIRRRPGHR